MSWPSAERAIAENLRISDRLNVIFPWHFAEDRALDKSTSDGENIGTTGRGIGPCYRDKVGRSHAVRLGDMYRPTFRAQVEHIVAAKNRVLAVLYPANEFKPLDAAAIFSEYSAYAERLRPYVCDTTELLLSAAESGKRILFEGAQGALLDVDHGTYPFVTSSNSSGVGISSGSGVPARHIDRIIGVVKAYSTRVGGGPFPTEQDNEIGQRMRDRGNEYGTVTRRPAPLRLARCRRRALHQPAQRRHVDRVMLLDVLTGFDELKICTAYKIDGRQTTQFPSHVDDLRCAEPVFETLPGWHEEITACRSFDKLPANAQSYLRRISELVGQPIEMVSVGPERDQTIRR